METPMSQHDDLNLMGMQELDSTLSIFDTSRPRETSTATSPSYQFDNPMDFTEDGSHTIVVQTSADQYSKLDHLGRAGDDILLNDKRSVLTYLCDSTYLILHFNPSIHEPQYLIWGCN